MLNKESTWFIIPAGAIKWVLPIWKSTTVAIMEIDSRCRVWNFHNWLKARGKANGDESLPTFTRGGGDCDV